MSCCRMALRRGLTSTLRGRFRVGVQCATKPQLVSPAFGAAAAHTLGLPVAAAGATAAAPRRPIACASYASPEVYDIAFSFRDFEAEVAFLLEAQQAHSTGPFRRFLDVGCGPARHAILLAQVIGTACVGVDTSPEMIAFATQRAQQAGVAEKLTFLQADMAAAGGFASQVPGGPVDMAAVMLGTLSHCLDNAAALQCFRNLAECVDWP